MSVWIVTLRADDKADPGSAQGPDTLRGDGAARAVRRDSPSHDCCVHWMDLRLFLCTHTHWMQHGPSHLMARAALSPGWIQKPLSGRTQHH